MRHPNNLTDISLFQLSLFLRNTNEPPTSDIESGSSDEKLAAKTAAGPKIDPSPEAAFAC
jgi:hypothetical protein